MKIDLIAGARPNFMKIAPIIKAIKDAQVKGINIQYRLVHTGQHYDKNMSETFFEQLNIPEPDVNLGIGSGTQAEQTARIMIAFEKDLMETPVDLVMVVGDVTSTMACSIAAKKLHVPVAHVEAGIRSGDLKMPEEINRIVTDSITDLFFTTTPEAGERLIKNGIREDRIYWVGNTMIDTLLHNLDRTEKPAFWEDRELKKGKYLVMTLHRPSNVDEANQLKGILDTITQNAENFPIVFPAHPRTQKQLQEFGINVNQLVLVEPLGYLQFIYLVRNSGGVITDSGGITEEATVLNIPCLTLRDSTERPETVRIGTNLLVGTDLKAIETNMQQMIAGNWKKGAIPDKWDGKTSKRIVEHLIDIFELEIQQKVSS